MSLKYIFFNDEGETMNDNNTYSVRFKGEKHRDNTVGVEFETLSSFACDRERYMSIVGAAIRNGLSFTASDGAFKNDNGGRDYCLSVYIW